ncbi:hypothetical protein [Candidatus Parabeggiatoa sp. HSG14]|uniref:hypothetical protein n=1 Tax=Candidatus Parabeggiatoa sp. HSG14 TaxID=3055593 RepID=UPI0025A79F2F|nr:hypothetical protein [Thiotrichales bacterium HSG14]
MAENNVHLINTSALFTALNTNRKNKGLTQIDSSLVASKLGILFTLKNKSYVNFKNESVELNEYQLTVLKEILDQHFNVKMTHEISILITQQHHEKRVSTLHHFTASASVQSSLFGKIKGFLKIGRSNIQERIA